MGGMSDTVKQLLEGDHRPAPPETSGGPATSGTVITGYMGNDDGFIFISQSNTDEGAMQDLLGVQGSAWAISKWDGDYGESNWILHNAKIKPEEIKDRDGAPDGGWILQFSQVNQKGFAFADACGVVISKIL